MYKADLDSSGLQEANLEGAKLEGANLKSADLSYANLKSANLQFAQISMANLSYADISNAKIFGISPWDCETTGLIANNVIKEIGNHQGLLPNFLVSTQRAPYILRLIVKGEYAQVSNVALILSHVEDIFSSSEIWPNRTVPQLYISSIDDGSIDIKIVVDLIKENLSLINTGVLSTALYYVLGIGIVTRVLREGLKIYVAAKKSLLEIDHEKLDIQKRELDLESERIDLEKKKLDLIISQAATSKKVHKMLKSIEEQKFLLASHQKDLALKKADIKIKEAFKKTPEKAYFEFIGLKLCEANIVNEELNRVLVLRIDDEGNIHHAAVSEIQLDKFAQKAQ